MTQRTYEQNCGLALSLDVLGERWTLLIIRELNLGPKRFGDLAGRLPGIATNILAARLKSLGAHDVLRRTTLPPPANVAAYELTPHGEALQPMLDGLALWGFRYLPDGAADRTTRVSWAALSMRAVYQQDPDPTLHLVMNLHVDDEQLVIRINGLDADVHHGTTRHDALNATTNLETSSPSPAGLSRSAGPSTAATCTSTPIRHPSNGSSPASGCPQ